MPALYYQLSPVFLPINNIHNMQRKLENNYLTTIILQQLSYNNTIANELTLNSNISQARSAQAKLCAMNDTAVINANITGATYQWQVSTDSINYAPITNNTNYSGTQSPNFTLTSIPETWAGRRYRCMVNGNQPGIFYTISFIHKWLGTQNNNWENPANWSCGTLPTAMSNVVIESGSIVINSNIQIKSLRVASNASVTVQQGYTLQITEQP
jgi:trimeric autotransporter adhesin